MMRRHKPVAPGCERAQACSTRSIALREFCKEMRLYGGLRSVPSIESTHPAFIASMRSPGRASARVDIASGEGKAGTESAKLSSSIVNLMLPWISGPGVEKCRLGGEPDWSQRTKMHTQSPGLRLSPAQPCAVRCCSPGILASVHWARALAIEATLMQATRRPAVNDRILPPLGDDPVATVACEHYQIVKLE